MATAIIQRSVDYRGRYINLHSEEEQEFHAVRKW